MRTLPTLEMHESHTNRIPNQIVMNGRRTLPRRKELVLKTRQTESRPTPLQSTPHEISLSLRMYINLIAHLIKTHFTPITSYITPYSLLIYFPLPIPSPQPTIPINTSIKLQHPTTHPLTPTFHLDETITHIPQHPSLFPTT